jgi:phenylacetate-CoA ligase
MKIPAIEKQSSEKIKAYQLDRLKELMVYLQERSPFYQRLFHQFGIKPNDVQSLEDLSKLPFTTKEDLQDFNKDFYCVPREKIIDYSETSGTSGNPVTVILTENDLERLAYNEAVSLACTGGNEQELYQLCTTIDKRFMAGLAYAMGTRKLGAGLIRMGSANPAMQWRSILKESPTALIIVPSYLLKLIEYAEATGIDFQKSSIKKAICIGEPIRDLGFEWNALGRRIKEKWDIALYSTYASTEMGAAFTECEAQKGGHHHPELVIVEIIDKNGHPVPDGSPGEVVVTTLGLEGMPLLRFRTGDICVAYKEPCSCGRKTQRLSPIIGRKKQMLKFRGTTLFVPAIYNTLNGIPSVKNYQVEVKTNPEGIDDVLILIGTDRQEEAIRHEIIECLRANLRVTPKIMIKPKKEVHSLLFPNGNRKPKVFVDKRHNTYSLV